MNYQLAHIEFRDMTLTEHVHQVEAAIHKPRAVTLRWWGGFL